MATTCLAPAALSPALADTRPSGLSVASGQVSVATPNPQTTVVTQSTGKAVLNWQSFSIGSGSSVVFQQPSSGSIALNRVTGPNASVIEGKLTANGQVWLINPSGVLFGPGAQVNVAGLVATTADIANGDFLAGNYNFAHASANPNASVVNKGNITVAPGGNAVLAGVHVDNRGLIEADLGTVVVGGAKTFALDLNGDKLVRFQISSPVDQTPRDKNGKPVDALVSNSGVIKAEGGKVLITARAAKGVIDQVINSTGIVEAKTARQENGEIVLDGGETGAVTVTGTLDASGRAAVATGGSVSVLGDEVALLGDARVDVSGAAGGGTALIGGNAHGMGPEPNATAAVVGPKARINANAVRAGKGGKVVVWSQNYTNFAGTVTAEGGAKSGDGGFVETSSHGNLQATGTVSAAAPHGTPGTWLLDPENVTITATTTTGGSFSNGNPSTFTPTADSAQASAATIDAALSAGTSVTITTGTTGAQAGNITVASPISAAIAGGTTPTLTLQAAGAIDVEAPITATSGALALNFSPGATGSITLNANLTTGGGAVTFNGPVLLGAPSLATNTTINTTGGPLGSVTFNGTVDAANFGASGLTISTSNAGVTFQQRVGDASNFTGSRLGDVSITGASNVAMNVADGAGGFGFSAKSVNIAAQNGVTSQSFIVASGGINISGGTGAVSAEFVDSIAGDSTTGPVGTSGNISISGSSITTTGFISARGGNATGASPANGGNAGQIQLTATGAISIGGVLSSQGGQSVAGNGGNAAPLTVSGGSINLASGAFSFGGDVLAGNGNGGAGANLSLAANGAISVASSGIFARGGNSANGGAHGGNGGAVTLGAGSTISVPGPVSTASAGSATVARST
jgi:filamentous hemagglutinin family protein